MSDPQWWLLDDLVLARATIERAAPLRADEVWVSRVRANPGTRFVHVHDGAALLSDGALVLSRVDDGDAPVTLLGVDEAQIAYFCVHHGHPDSAPQIEGAYWSDLRMSAASLDDTDAGLMVSAVALDNWSRAHRHCPRCGGELQWREAGWARHCPTDGSSHFPRTDPAVIVLVRDDRDRALLGRQVRWEPTWFSTLAGFVEAGESAEAAVRREVNEESGVRIGNHARDLVYLGSQPWPFPASLMLGYHAWAAESTIEVDGEEIAEARWFTREELADACESGDVSLPPSVSIARKLIERWFGSELPGEWSRPLARPSGASDR
jgi:NAD+ diphosphatase